jgi:hypothetical protein
MPGPTTVAFLKGDHVLLVKKTEGLRKPKHVWDLPKEATISAELGSPLHVIDWIGGAIKVYGAKSMPPIARSSLLAVDAIRRIPTRIRDSTDRTVRHARVQPLLEYMSHHPTGLPFMGTDLKLSEPTVNQVVEDADGQQHLLETPLPATQPPSPVTQPPSPLPPPDVTETDPRSGACS